MRSLAMMGAPLLLPQIIALCKAPQLREGEENLKGENMNADPFNMYIIHTVKPCYYTNTNRLLTTLEWFKALW